METVDSHLHAAYLRAHKRRIIILDKFATTSGFLKPKRNYYYVVKADGLKDNLTLEVTVQQYHEAKVHATGNMTFYHTSNNTLTPYLDYAISTWE